MPMYVKRHVQELLYNIVYNIPQIRNYLNVPSLVFMQQNILHSSENAPATAIRTNMVNKVLLYLIDSCTILLKLTSFGK